MALQNTVNSSIVQLSQKNARESDKNVWESEMNARGKITQVITLVKVLMSQTKFFLIFGRGQKVS